MKKLVKESLNEVNIIKKDPKILAITIQQLCKSYQESLKSEEIKQILLKIAEIYK